MWQAWVLNNAGFGLRALGRLAEAAGPMQDGLEMHIRQEKWENAARSAANLSQLFLALGEVAQSVEYGKRSVALADRSSDAFQQAEAMQREDQPQYPLLASLPGYKYCDQLLALDRPAKARERAEKTLERISQGWRNGMTPGSCIRILLRTSISLKRKNDSTWRVPRRSLLN